MHGCIDSSRARSDELDCTLAVPRRRVLDRDWIEREAVLVEKLELLLSTTGRSKAKEGVLHVDDGENVEGGPGPVDDRGLQDSVWATLAKLLDVVGAQAMEKFVAAISSEASHSKGTTAHEERRGRCIESGSGSGWS